MGSSRVGWDPAPEESKIAVWVPYSRHLYIVYGNCSQVFLKCRELSVCGVGFHCQLSLLCHAFQMVGFGTKANIISIKCRLMKFVDLKWQFHSSAHINITTSVKMFVFVGRNFKLASCSGN